MDGATSDEGAPPGFTVGDVVADRYQLLEALSGSPLRSVFRAYDQEVEVEVALWLLRAEIFGGEPGATAAAEAMRRVRNRNVLRLFDSAVITAEDQPSQLYLAWQLGTSASLESLLASGTPASHSQLWRLGEGLASALQAGHDKGLVHGWLSPADAVEVAGQVKLCGLGLLAKLDSEWVIPRWGEAARYVAPEILSGTSGPTRMTDWYSLGAVLLDLATGMRDSAIEDARGELATSDPQLLAALEPALRVVASARPHSAQAFLEPLRIACGQSEENPPVSSTIVDGMFDNDSDGGQEIGGLLSDDDDDATEVHVPGGRVDRSTEELLSPSPVAAPNGAVSLKPKEIARPVAPVPLKSPVKPTIRPLTSLPGADVARQDLGNYAPRRASTTAGERRRHWLVLALALAAGAASVSLVLALRGRDSSESTSAARSRQVKHPSAGATAMVPKPRPVQAPPVALVAPCPDDMVLHTPASGAAFCVDTYESPGARRTPQTGMALEQAAEQCRAAGKRLCSAAEWERSCRDRGVTSWPYGSRYEEEICNISGGKLGLTGALTQCRTSLGVYDMSGNVAEWVAEGQIRGGSASDRSKGRCSQVRPNPGAQDAYSDVGFRCCADAIDSKTRSD